MNKIIVNGKIRGKQRPRMTKFGHTYTPQQTVDYENWIRLNYQQQCGQYFNEPVAVYVWAYHKIPKSFSKKKIQEITDKCLPPVRKPDGDNILKAVLDGLAKNGLAMPDDTYVTTCLCKKLWTLGEERLEIEVQPENKKETKENETN